MTELLASTDTNTGQLPKGWDWTTVSEVSDTLKAGGTPSTKRQDFYDGDILYAKVEDAVEAGKYLSSTKITLTQAGIDNSSAWKVPAGTLLYTMYASYGVPTITSAEMATNQAIIACAPDSGLALTEYLYYYLWNIKPTLYKRIRGTTQSNLNAGIVKDLEVPLPPLNEQRRIVEKIEELFTRLDAGVEALKHAKAQLKKYRQSVLNAAVTGELSREWREDHADELEPASELLQRILEERREKWTGKKYKEPVEPDKEGLPGLPPSWAWVRLESMAVVKGGITKDSKRKHETFRRVPYLRVANVQRGYLDLSEMKEIDVPESVIDQLRLEPGDVLFNEGGDRDKLGRGWVWDGQIPECIHQNHVFRARLYNGEVEPKFVSWFGNTYGQAWFMRQGKQTTNLASINLTKLSAFPVPLPPPDEQRHIVSEVERRLSVIDRLEVTIEDSLKRSGSLRQSILKRAFSGGLVEQDPDEEPASVLLERIREEREASERKGKKGPSKRAAPSEEQPLFSEPEG